MIHHFHPGTLSRLHIAFSILLCFLYRKMQAFRFLVVIDVSCMKNQIILLEKLCIFHPREVFFMIFAVSLIFFRRHTDRQTDTETETETERQTHRHIDRLSYHFITCYVLLCCRLCDRDRIHKSRAKPKTHTLPLVFFLRDLFDEWICRRVRCMMIWPPSQLSYWLPQLIMLKL